VEFGILGSLTVQDDGRPVELTAAKQRTLLGVLLLHPDETVSRERLIDELWGESPPRTASNALHTYVSDLRRVLGRESIETHPDGYRIQLEPGGLDASRFSELLIDARSASSSGELTQAIDLYEQALALWRGPALASVQFESFARNEVERLEELRLTATLERIDCELALGRDGELVGELEALVARNPFRERLRGQLMLALYRAGRQADALDAYQQARRTLSDELGLEPGDELKQLERRILDHDPTLLVARRAPAPPGERRRTRLRAAAVVAVFVIVIAIVAPIELVGGGSGSHHALKAIPAQSVGAVDPRSYGISSTASVPGEPDRLAAGTARLWTTTGASLVAVDPGRAKIDQIVQPGVDPTDVAVGFRSVWVLGGDVAQIDPVFGSVTRRIPIRPSDDSSSAYGQPTAIAAGAGAVWVADLGRGIVRIDPAGGKATTIPVGRRVDGVAVGDGAVWAVSGPTATVLRLDPRNDAVTPIPIVSKAGVLSPYPYMVAVGEGFVWVVNGNTSTLTKIDPALRGVVQTVPLGHDANSVGLAVGAGAAWVVDTGDGTLVRVDARTNDVTSIPLGPNRLRDAQVFRGKVWVSVQAP
jgi:DNA-binding SARP family transcriptional activator